ncbi:MAG: helix-turn-helix transcriptional regulator [Firmicutes bacterium]|nr:helix-turn-helix transcriptional regulator [Bacillota bacterium]
MREWLKMIRKQLKITHDDVAKAAEIERAYYTMIENGTRNPSVDVAKRIATVMGFDWTLFFDNKSNEMTHIPTGTG